MVKTPRWQWLTLAILFLSVTTLLAQTAGTGALTGTVKDPQGAVVPNVTVTATNAGTGQVRSATSGADGIYNIGLLPPGQYTVKFEAAGFQKVEVPSVTVTVTETAVLDRSMSVGAQSQEVTVQAETEAIQTATSAMGTVIASRTVTDLPLNTRNFTNLIGLSTGVAASVQNASAIGKGSMGTAVNGATNTQNNYQMDGVSVNNWNSTLGMAGGEGGSTGFIVIPNPDSIQEFKIQTSNYDASYGRNPGAAVNVVTKSGTNQWHGAAFEFLRNTALNANDWFLNNSGKPKGVLNQHQFGGAIGGPIKKDKLFFYINFQETTQKNGIASGSLSNPILPVIPTGDRNSQPWLDAMYAQYCNTRGNQGGVQIQAPSSGTCTPARPAFAAATVPINPVALNILRLKLPDGSYYIPSGGNGTSPIASSIPALYREHQAIANGDYVINPANTFSVRYMYSLNPQTIAFPGGSTQLAGFPNEKAWTNESGVIKLTTIISNSLVNEFHGAYQRYINNNNSDPSNTTFTNPQVGISPLGSRRIDLSAITIGGFQIGQYVFGGAYIVTNQQNYGDQVSWTHGKHTLRTGLDFNYYNRFYDFVSLMLGGINFQSFSDFLIGLPGCTANLSNCNATNPQGTNGTNQSNINAISNAVRPGVGGLQAHTPARDWTAFVQDDYKLSRKLTLNLGLRWEYFGFLYEEQGKLTNQWLSQLNQVRFPLASSATACAGTFPTVTCPGGTYVGYVVPSNYNAGIYGSLPSGVLVNSTSSSPRTTPQKHNFAPRVGFAWQPFDNVPLAIRGGGGFFYHRSSADDFYVPAARQPPYAANRNFSGTSNVASSLAVPFDPTGVGFVPRWYTTSGLSSNLAFPLFAENAITPTVYQYNLTVQYEFLPRWVMEVGYAGSRGTHQFLPAGSTDGTRFNPAQFASASNPVNCGYDGNPANCITTTTTTNVNLRVPYLGVATTDYIYGPFEDYKYNSLQATVRKQFSHGFQFQTAYTFSRAFQSTYQGVNANYPVAHVYGMNPQYRPHRLTANFSWDLPIPQMDGFAGKIFNGWTGSGVFTIQNGQPLTLTDTRGGTAFGTAVTSTAQYATGANSGNVLTSGSTSSRVGSYFNTAAFTAPPLLIVPGCNPAAPGTVTCGTAYGNAGQGIVLGPGQSNWDLTLAKTTVVGGLRENATLQFRAEFFNAFNHPQFSNPGTVVNTVATFGRITTTSVNPRLIQLALKYNF